MDEQASLNLYWLQKLISKVRPASILKAKDYHLWFQQGKVWLYILVSKADLSDGVVEWLTI